MHNRSDHLYVDQADPEWERMWAALAASRINEGLTDRRTAMFENNEWQYMGSSIGPEDEYCPSRKRIFHHFRHRMHPVTRSRENLRIQASQDFVGQALGDEGTSPAPEGEKGSDALVKTFIQHSRTWYKESNKLGPDVVDEILIEVSSPDNGLKYEFLITWKRIGADKYRPATPVLEIFSEAWSAFKDLAELFTFMGSDAPEFIQPDTLVTKLLELGFQDGTPTRRDDKA